MTQLIKNKLKMNYIEILKIPWNFPQNTCSYHPKYIIHLIC